MKTLFSRRDLFAVFASVFLCVFMVGVITYGASVMDTDSIGVGTSTPGAGLYVSGGMTSFFAGDAYIYGQTNMSYFVATSTTATSTTRFGLTLASTTIVDGYSGRWAIGTSTVPGGGAAGTLSLDPGLTVTGVGNTAGATGTIYIAGGGNTGGQIIIKSASGDGCGIVVFDDDGGTVGTAVALSAKIVECPK